MAASSERHIAEILLVAQTNDGELSLVRFTDGGWGLARNREPWHDYYWPPNHFDQCVQTFVRVANIKPVDGGK